MGVRMELYNIIECLDERGYKKYSIDTNGRYVYIQLSEHDLEKSKTDKNFIHREEFHSESEALDWCKNLKMICNK